MYSYYNLTQSNYMYGILFPKKYTTSVTVLKYDSGIIMIIIT